MGERVADPVAMYKADLATLPSSLYGGPAMSLPAGLGDDDLPVGLQLMAPVQHDERVYRVGAALEAALVDRWGGPLLDRAPALGGTR
jgi:aspartyl-tRNA(Asn)/glutamyl-tRNA(Gln) amidotransferase subunit A